MKRTQDQRMPGIYELLLGAAVLLFTGMWLAAAGLQTGDWADNMLMLIVLTLFGVLALLLIYRDGVDPKLCVLCALPVLLGMLLRIRCLDYSSGDYESFLSRWLQYFRDNGGFAAIKSYSGDYNAPYLYILAIISMMKEPELYLIKVVSILSDVALAWGGFRVVKAIRQKGPDDPAPCAAFAILLILPTVIANSAYWGQCDSLYGALVLHAIAKALTGKEKTSAALLGAAFAVKLQTVFLIPLWGALWLGKRIKLRNLFMAPVSFIVLCLPAVLLGRPIKDIVSVYFNQTTEYSDRLVLNAPSAYQFIPYGKEVDTASAARVGIIAAFALVLLLMVVALVFRGKLDNRASLAMAAVMAIGVPFLLPHMHERYFYLADVVMVCMALVNRKALPCALLTWVSSMASYIVYLRLKYNWVVSAFGNRYVMGGEALLMLLALIWAIGILVLELIRSSRKPDMGTEGFELVSGPILPFSLSGTGVSAGKKSKGGKESAAEDKNKTAKGKPAGEGRQKPGKRLAREKAESRKGSKPESADGTKEDLDDMPIDADTGRIVLPGADKLPEVWSLDMDDEDMMEDGSDDNRADSAEEEGSKK